MRLFALTLAVCAAVEPPAEPATAPDEPSRILSLRSSLSSAALNLEAWWWGQAPAPAPPPPREPELLTTTFLIAIVPVLLVLLLSFGLSTDAADDQLSPFGSPTPAPPLPAEANSHRLPDGYRSHPPAERSMLSDGPSEASPPFWALKRSDSSLRDEILDGGDVYAAGMLPAGCRRRTSV